MHVSRPYSYIYRYSPDVSTVAAHIASTVASAALIASASDLRTRGTATLGNALQHRATHCNTLQHTATHCNTLQHTAMRYNTLHQHLYWARRRHQRLHALDYSEYQWRDTATHCNTQQHIATHCNTLQHIATHCNALQHNATYRAASPGSDTMTSLRTCHAHVFTCMFHSVPG